MRQSFMKLGSVISVIFLIYAIILINFVSSHIGRSRKVESVIFYPLEGSLLVIGVLLISVGALFLWTIGWKNLFSNEYRDLHVLLSVFLFMFSILFLIYSYFMYISPERSVILKLALPISLVINSYLVVYFIFVIFSGMPLKLVETVKTEIAKEGASLCPSCGLSIKSMDEFCPHCGAEIK